MADFCQQCSIEMFGEDMKDLAGLIPPDKVAEPGWYALVICEGCGPIDVDNDGRCMTPDCLHKHGEKHGEDTKATT